ncbi:MAG TPA: RNA 3'-terminal phosphate cyclase [Phycisphaerae bacterium]|nr:RNA 3'-terminal phosphate cyclase [Phycisphaerae bacterium]
MIEIDGSYGEGGGQIVRTSLTLSAATGVAVRLVKMRANRHPPGLRPQHVAAVRAAADICGASIARLEPGIDELVFEPGPVQPGEYSWQIGTAGSASLVLQTVAVPLAMADGASRVEIVGGTHNPKAPCFEYLDQVWRVWLERIGVGVELAMDSAGFYPKGGGRIVAHIAGGVRPDRIRALHLQQRGELVGMTGVSAVANLPDHIAQRQRARAVADLKRLGIEARIDTAELASIGKGTVCFLRAEFEHSIAGFFALGALGKKAELVGHEAAEAARKFCTERSGAAVDPHAADQLIVALVLAARASRYRTTALTEHTSTNAAVASQITGREVRIEGKRGDAGEVVIE